MKKISIVFGLSLIMLFSTTNLIAANQTVTNNNDSGAGSLRQAITDVGIGEEITFDDDYTITLASELTIDKSLTITGTGAGNTIIQANANPNTATYRVFSITSGNATLSEMTIRNGGGTYSGSGIYNLSGTLTITNCTISGNTSTNYGGGIYNEDNLNMSSCTVSGNTVSGGAYGGGIENNEGTLSMTNCTVSGNSTSGSAYGGGIHNDDGAITMSNCTISGNDSGWGAGGIYNAGSSATTTMTNCTVSGNIANDGALNWGDGGGIYNYDGTVTMTNCTVSENHVDATSEGYGGGYYNSSGTLIIKNTIIANNTTGAGNDDYYFNSGTLTDNGYNIVEITNVGAGAGGFSNGTNNDIVGEQANLNLSATLADNNTLNGTQTLKTTSGSVAINAGTSSGAPTNDQRGEGRNGNTDIGAYEWWDDSGSLPVTLSTFTAQYLNSKPTLYWQTQSEEDNMGWFIYRNTIEDFISSEKISALIEGHGTTTQPQDYIYEDAEQLQIEQTYYYWLESIDYSGTIHHFDMVAHVTIPHTNDPGQNITPPTAYEITADPNPFSYTTNITFAMNQTSFVDLAIYNVRGQLVKSFGTVMTNVDEEVSFQ